MPLRVSNACERTVKAEPAKAITLAAATSTIVLPDLNPIAGQTIANPNTDWGFEIAARYIFNDTGGKLYYAFGTDKCDNVSTYHGVMADQQMLDASNCGQEVSVYSVAGGKVAITIMHRQDLFPHRGANSLPAQQT